MIRDEWHFDAAEMDDFFFVRVLGGAWTLARRGVAADSVGYLRRNALRLTGAALLRSRGNKLCLSLDTVE